MLAIMAISSNRIRRIVKKEGELDYGLNEVVSIALCTLTLLSLSSKTEYHFIAHSNLEWAGPPYLVEDLTGWTFYWCMRMGSCVKFYEEKLFASRGNNHCKDWWERFFTYSRNSKELLSSGEWARESRKSEMVL